MKPFTFPASQAAAAIVVSVCLFGCADPNEAKQAKTQAVLKSLEGFWAVKTFDRNGKGMPPHAAEVNVVVNADKLTVIELGPSKGGGANSIRDSKVEVYVIQPDPDNPFNLDLAVITGPDQGKSRKALYEIADGLLKLCYGELAGPRPSAFNPGEKTTFMILARKTDSESGAAPTK